MKRFAIVFTLRNGFRFATEVHAEDKSVIVSRLAAVNDPDGGPTGYREKDADGNEVMHVYFSRDPDYYIILKTSDLDGTEVIEIE
jgi:hypothetical protein